MEISKFLLKPCSRQLGNKVGSSMVLGIAEERGQYDGISAYLVLGVVRIMSLVSASWCNQDDRW